VLYIFAAFLMFTGIKMLWASDHAPDIASNPVVRWI
jgi:tellurite resistance protein TerC